MRGKLYFPNNNKHITSPLIPCILSLGNRILLIYILSLYVGSQCLGGKGHQFDLRSADRKKNFHSFRSRRGERKRNVMIRTLIVALSTFYRDIIRDVNDNSSMCVYTCEIYVKLDIWIFFLMYFGVG